MADNLPGNTTPNVKYIGRKKILCDEKQITAANVVAILSSALLIHDENSAQINYLHNYRRGDQPILKRLKKNRPEICNRIVENVANEIVAFRTGNLCGEPIQYVSRGKDASISDEIQKLNDQMLLIGKENLDIELCEWRNTCGTGYRMVISNAEYIKSTVTPWLNNQGELDPDESVIKAYTLDPRYSFVIYYSGLGEPPIAGVKYIEREDKTKIYTVYTNEYRFDVIFAEGQEATVKEYPHALKFIPIIEYPLNSIRLGAMELVLPLLDALNTVSSNRIDGIEQFIQSLIVLYGIDIDGDEAVALKDKGVIKLPAVTDAGKVGIDILASQLQQADTQTVVDYMRKTIYEIVGMPTNSSGGMSTSDTGRAVEMRDGWSSTETLAKPDEKAFKLPERIYFLRAVLRIMRDTIGTSLTLKDIDIKFTRRIYEGLVAKSQVLLNMLATNKIAPELAFSTCGLFSDPEDAAKKSQEYYDKVKITIPDTAKATVSATADEAAGEIAPDLGGGSSV